MTGSCKSETAVSESLGYILICMMLFVSFVLIYTIGYPVYNNYVDNGHMQNVAKSFSILASNGNGVAMQKMIVSSTEMKMYGGTLATRDTGYMNVSYYNSALVLMGCSNSTLTTLEYSKGTVKVAYVDGSVCMADQSGTVMIRDPEISNTTGALVIPMIGLGSYDISMAGNTLARITLKTPYYSKMAQMVSSPAPQNITGVYRVKITVAGDYAPCFSQYLQDQLGFTESVDANGALVLTRDYPAGINLYLVKSDVTISVN